MKRAFIILMIFGSVLLFADEKSPVVVKNTSVTTGVIIIDVQLKGKPAELQCNEGSPSGTKLKPGDYRMVQLRKNHGMYDCQNGEFYWRTASDIDKKMGGYGL